jgi:hypothetical protein
VVPIELDGSPLRLLVHHNVVIVEDQPQTASYTYRLSSGDDKRDWVLRWEYQRSPATDYDYPSAHLHANASFLDAGTEMTNPLERLHVATARVAFELVLWHSIADWGVEPRTPDWRDILLASIAEFEERRTAP